MAVLLKVSDQVFEPAAQDGSGCSATQQPTETAREAIPNVCPCGSRGPAKEATQNVAEDAAGGAGLRRGGTRRDGRWLAAPPLEGLVGEKAQKGHHDR